MNRDEFESTWRQRFEKFGAAYDDDALVAGWSRNGLSTRLRRFSQLLGSITGAWLDVGCGAGTYIRLLSDAGANDTCGVDYSLPSLRRAVQHSGQGRWLLADGQRLPFRSQSWDGVICFGVTQALSGSAALVRELVRVTRPGGQVWVDGLNAAGVVPWMERLLRRESRVRFEHPARIAGLLHEAGCTEIRTHWIVMPPGRLATLQPVVDRLGLHGAPGVRRLLAHAFIVTGRRA